MTPEAANDRGASRKILWPALAAGTVLSMAASAAVAAQWLILGSFEGRFFYGYEQPFTVRPLIVVVLVTIAAAALLRVPMQPAGQGQWRLLVVWLVLGFAVQATVRSLTPVSLESIFLSDAANSFYSVTQQHDASDVLGRFNRIRSQAPLHVRSNMPGKLLFSYALEMVSTRPAVLAWLVVIASNMGAVLMYLFVRDLIEDTRAALFAAVLYLFVPAKLLFFPLMNTVTPLVILTCACLLLRWLRTGSAAYAALLGVALYVLVFFEPLPLVMGLLFGALALRAIARGQISWDRFVVQAALMVLALIATSEAVRLWFDFDLVRAFGQIREHAVEFNAIEGRAYRVWVRANLGEFLFGVGVSQAVVFCGALFYAVSGGRSWGDRLTHPFTTLCLGLLAVLIATDLIGVNRGEVIRLWIFLACFFQIPAAYVCSRLQSTHALLAILFTSILQAALGTSMIRFLVP